MTNASPVFGAIGPSHVDPRSGEILDADIGIESLSSRNIRATRAQVLTGAGVENPFGAQPLTAHELQLLASGRFCNYEDEAGEQMAYALDVLEARGDLDPDSPEAAAFVEAYLKDVTMHEVGHTLGLRHNFRSSRAYTLKQLADPAFTRANGITGSVMDYAPINLNAPDEPRASYGTPFSDTLGPYDYWAIEFAYKPLPDGLSPAEEKAALEKIAARSAEPQLAYGTDEDNFLGIDPESLQNDLGNDAIGFAKKRIAIAQDLLKRQESRQLRPDQDYNLLKRSVSYAIRDVARAANVLSRQIGGVRTVRDCAGHRPRSARAGAGGRPARGARRHHRQPALRRQPARLADAAAQARHRLQRALGGDVAAARARPRPTTRPPSRCSACSARCWPC